MDKRKGFFKKNSDEVHLRSKYSAPSRAFHDWISDLRLEQTFLGNFVSSINERFNLKGWVFVFIFCLVLSFVIFWDVNVFHEVAAGDVAHSDIKSPISFQMVDTSASDEKRQLAEYSIPPVFDFDSDTYEQLITRVYRSFRRMRREIKSIRWPSNAAQREQEIKDFTQFKPVFERELGVEVPDRMFEWLTENRFAAPIENILIRALMKWKSRKIMDGQTTLFKSADAPLVWRSVGSRADDSDTESTMRRDEVYDVKKLSEFNFDDVAGVDRLNARDKRVALEIAHLLVVPNLSFNRTETLQRRARASDSILPVLVSIKKGQTIVSAGSVIQPLQVGLINELNKLRSSRHTDFISLVVALLFLILAVVFFSYLRRAASHKINIGLKDIYAMGSVVLLIVVMTKVYMFVTDAFLATKGAPIPANSLLFAAPVAAGPMLVGLMITAGEIVWLFTIFTAITLAFMVDPNFNFIFLLVTAIGGIAAARGVVSCTKRNDIYWAGVRTGLVQAAVLTVVTFLQPGDHPVMTLLIWNVPLGFVGGMLSALVTMALIPLFETIFNYTTDVKLLELSSLNHPLMKDMIVKAAGTYHHSLVVGSMCEAAAEEIGANPLLAKVMAYYHDIGKMEHAHYFIENQRQGNNPHDHISPNMSKTVLIAHVKDGAEMGHTHKLGPAIIDGILQHHGTTLISYFYNKALEEQDEEIDTVHEDDFRYPGPKPQFKEAALLMLADSIEAAARSLDEPTPGRLTSLVRNIIQSKFLDGQLEECDLTLRDLSIIEESYRRVILGIYHQRIDYPTVNPRLPAALPPGPNLSAPGSRQRKKGNANAT
jgi:cyclic-di-AMP phosphodiesterase PgpH